MYLFDEDSANDIVMEDRRQKKEERELKNKILNIYNYDRKKAEWHKHFAQPQLPETDLVF